MSMVRIFIRVAMSIVLLLMLLIVVTPSAYADNCGSLSDCTGTIQAAILALLGLALLLLFIAFLPEILAGLAGLAELFGGFGGGTLALAGAGTLSSNIAAAAAGISGVAAQGAAVATATAVAGELILMMSSDGTPGNNQAQNKQFRDAVRQYERETGNKLDQDQVRQIHDEITGQNMSYHEIIQAIYDLFGGGE